MISNQGILGSDSILLMHWFLSLKFFFKYNPDCTLLFRILSLSAQILIRNKTSQVMN